MESTYRIAGLAERVRWAYEAISEVATSLLEAERNKLSSQAFNCELELAKLHEELLQLIRQAPSLPVRKDATRPAAEDLPF